MNRQRAKELLPIIEAYANGEEVEFKHQVTKGQWFLTVDPHFLDGAEYRIKPESKKFRWTE